MKVITNELRINASQLSDGLRGVKRDLLNMLTKCDHPDCKQILSNYSVGTLDANGFDYNKVSVNYRMVFTSVLGEWDLLPVHLEKLSINKYIKFLSCEIIH